MNITLPPTAATPIQQTLPAKLSNLGNSWQSWIRSQPMAARIGIATAVGAAVGGLIGMIGGPVGGVVGAIAGGGLLFFATKSMSSFG